MYILYYYNLTPLPIVYNSTWSIFLGIEKMNQKSTEKIDFHSFIPISVVSFHLNCITRTKCNTDKLSCLNFLKLGCIISFVEPHQNQRLHRLQPNSFLCKYIN